MALAVAVSWRAAVARHAAAGKAQTLSAMDAAASWTRADEGRLAQVVDNFVVNAMRFSPRETAVRIEVARRGDAAVRLAVSDAGPGIAAVERAGLFRMFGRGSARPTGGEASHGLGLAVGCESEFGRGATFWVEVPGDNETLRDER